MAQDQQLQCSAGTKFSSSIDGLTYTFVTVGDHVVQAVDGVYTAQSLNVYEGTYVSYNYTFDSTDIDQRFLMTIRQSRFNNNKSCRD